MITRYSLKEMSDIWSLESRFKNMLTVEKAVAQVQGELGLIPKQAAVDISKKASFSLEGILEKEKVTFHDVTAFVQEVASHLGDSGAFVHYGLTSSDVLDTALSLQLREASLVIRQKIQDLKKVLNKIVLDHKETICLGRTHGIHAEPTTFGFKMLGHLLEIERAEKSFEEAIEQCCVGKLSGAVGTYSALPPELEQKVCKQLDLKPETLATQVIPRDRFARVIFSLSLIGSCFERLSVELRHLQRTELSEVTEGFKKGQTGSSAMPHKKNPISSENLTGVARLLRSYVQPSLENIALWHERDISHSSVERVIFPDAFILVHYGLNRLCKLLTQLSVNKDRMLKNLWSSGGLVFSSQVLNQLVAKGLPRLEAYPLVQRLSHEMKEGDSLKDILLKNKEVGQWLNSKEIEDIFSGANYLKSVLNQIDKICKENKYER